MRQYKVKHAHTVSLQKLLHYQIQVKLVPTKEES